MLLLADRKRAIGTGILFIVATLMGLVGDGILGDGLRAPDFLGAISADRSRLILAALAKVVGDAASVGIAISLYPVLRRHAEGLALGSVCFRLIEGVFYLISCLCLLSLAPLAAEAAKAGSALAAQARELGELIQGIGSLAGFGLAVIAFCIGASMYYYVFFRTRLVPRWLSLWGLIALALLLAMLVLGMFEGAIKPTGIRLLLAMPIFAQEIVLAVWLIAKGFDPVAEAAK
jgi:hypothetical protein